MPTVQIRHTDGTWRALTEGKLKVGWGAAWVTPAKMRIGWGGGWIDTGYVGTPAEPVNVAINAWNYDTVSIKWGAGSGGAAVASYDVQQRNSSGGVIATVSDAASPSGNFAVSDMTKYQFYVRSKTAGGVVSDWAGPVRPSIGKPAVTTYTTEWATKPWENAQAVNSYKDVSAGCVIPTSVTLYSVRFVIYANSHFTDILCPYNNRQIYGIHNGGLGGQFSWQAWSIDQWFAWDYVGNGQITGLRCAGTGWSIYSTGLQRALGHVYAYGNERYSYQQAHTTPAVANTYW